MFFIRDTVRKLKPDEKIKFPKGFLVFEMDKNSKASLEIKSLCEEIDKGQE